MVWSTRRNRCFSVQTWCAAACALGLVFCASTAFAQLPQARLYSIFPCGGKAGTTFDLELTRSEDLDEADRLVFNHPGITAVPKTRDAAGRKESIPNTFSVTIAPNVPSGVYELYAGGLFGLSNPRTFVVGSQSEAREVEPNNDLDRANPLPLNAIVNGTIGSDTDVDVYRFEGKKGQRFVAFCRAADIDSRLEPVLELTDNGGRRLGYSRAGTASGSAGRRCPAGRCDLLLEGPRSDLSGRARICATACQPARFRTSISSCPPRELPAQPRSTRSSVATCRAASRPT